MTLAVTRGIGTAFGGKKHLPPFVSQRYRLLNEQDIKTTGQFPYDVPFYTSREVRDLVNLSKQYYYSDLVVLRLTQHPTFPQTLVKCLAPLKGLRFFYDELNLELQKLLSPGEYRTWNVLICSLCGDFSKLATPLWTWERAEAHLQKNDPLLRRASASDYLWTVWQRYAKAGRRPSEHDLFKHAQAHQLGQNITPPMWIQHNSRVTGIAPDALWGQELKKQGHDIEELRRTHFTLLSELPTP